MNNPRGGKKIWLVVAVAFIAAILLAPATPASADDDPGNGSTTCVRGEICFFYLQTSVLPESDNPTRQFYYNDSNHCNNTLSNGQLLCDNVRAYRNRDTQCAVWVKHLINGVFTWGWGPNDGVYRTNDPAYWDNNRAHYRCSHP